MLLDDDGDSALHLVENVQGCQRLIDLGFDINQRNNEDKLPIESHWIQGNDDIVDCLQEVMDAKSESKEWVRYEEEREDWAAQEIDDNEAFEKLQYLLKDAETSSRFEAILSGAHHPYSLETIPEE